MCLLTVFAQAAATPDTRPVAADTLQIGVLYWSMNIPGQVAMRRGLEARASELATVDPDHGGHAFELVARVAGDGPEGIENQIAQMFELLTLGADLLIVQPTDNAALSQPLREANRLGVPVIAYDQFISGGDLACFLTSNNYQAGYLDGEYVAHLFPAERDLAIVLVEYPHVTSTSERVNGFLSALDHSGQAHRVVGSYLAVEPVAGREAGEAILRDFPEPGSVDVVFTVNDGGGLAVVDVLADAGRSEIVIATVDGDPKSEENIRSRRLTVIDTAQFCWHLGAEAMQAAWDLLGGTELPPIMLLPVFPITVETQDLYEGWYGP